jgi:CRP-like cAMP-binding protein
MRQGPVVMSQNERITKDMLPNGKEVGVMLPKARVTRRCYWGIADGNLGTTRKNSTFERAESEQAVNYAEIPAFCPAVQGGGEHISDLPRTEHVSAGVILAKQDEKPAYVRLIHSGIVKLSYLDASGKEFILGLRTEGWWVSSTQVLLDVPNLCTVATLTSCSYSSITADDFSQRLLKDPRMMRHYLSSLCREVVIQSKLHIMLESASAESRLCHLLEEHEKSVWKTLDPTAIMRQADVAKLLSVTPEHLSRILHKHFLPSED